MENIKEVTDSYGEIHIIVEHADGSFTSMLKSTYEAQQAQHFTPIVTAE